MFQLNIWMFPVNDDKREQRAKFEFWRCWNAIFTERVELTWPSADASLNAPPYFLKTTLKTLFSYACDSSFFKKRKWQPQGWNGNAIKLRADAQTACAVESSSSFLNASHISQFDAHTAYGINIFFSYSLATTTWDMFYLSLNTKRSVLVKGTPQSVAWQGQNALSGL